MTNTYYFDMDGVLAQFHTVPTEQRKIFSRSWIANLAPFVESIALVKELIAAGEEVNIISECTNEQARLGKMDWLGQYLPEIKEENIFIIVGHGNKATYIHSEHAVLIDDNMKNIKQWHKAGHRACFVEHKGCIDLGLID